MKQKKSHKITLVLLTTGSLLSQLTGCSNSTDNQSDSGGGGVYYSQSDRGWHSGYNNYGGRSYKPTSFSSSLSRGGFGGGSGGGS